LRKISDNQHQSDYEVTVNHNMVDATPYANQNNASVENQVQERGKAGESRGARMSNCEVLTARFQHELKQVSILNFNSNPNI